MRHLQTLRQMLSNRLHALEFIPFLMIKSQLASLEKTQDENRVKQRLHRKKLPNGLKQMQLLHIFT